MGQAMQYPERIERLHARKAEKGLSCQQITDIVTEAGDFTSLGTVKKVFSADAKSKKFKDITLQPIEKALGLLDEVKPAAMSKATEEFYQAIIRELNAQAKESRKVHQVKNIAIVFLVALQFIILVLDRINPNIGWYQPGTTSNWSTIATLFTCFCLAALGYLLYRRSENKKDE